MTDAYRSHHRAEALAKEGRAITPASAYTEREVLSGLSREFGFHHNDPMFALVTLIAAYDTALAALPFKPGDRVRYTRPVTDLHNGWFNDREMLANEVGTIRNITFNGVHYIWQALVTYDNPYWVSDRIPFKGERRYYSEPRSYSMNIDYIEKVDVDD